MLIHLKMDGKQAKVHHKIKYQQDASLHGNSSEATSFSGRTTPPANKTTSIVICQDKSNDNDSLTSSSNVNSGNAQMSDSVDAGIYIFIHIITTFY